ncbi:MAG TPA: sulfatase-like hydrolase/transferase, partial [Planctomycetota bacterium]|nr:sulfatase-like hydrolase/transferase [Planctomycetota bacterium]
MRAIARCALLASALGLPPACGPDSQQAPPAKERPDLVLIVVDALRADHLTTGGYGRPTSPMLAALAARGVVFDDNTAQSSATLPSMVSLMLGRSVLADAQRVPAGVHTLAERLAAAGYQTVAFAGNPLVSRAAGFDRGFEVFLTRDETGHETWDFREVHALVTGWLDKNPRDGRPRFFYIHLLDPHAPYAPVDRPTLAGENPKLGLEQRVRRSDDVFAAWAEVIGAAGAGTPLYDTFNAEHWNVLEAVDAYDREIANVDAAIKAILDAFGPGGRLVIVAADHGEALWERVLPAPL